MGAPAAAALLPAIAGAAGGDGGGGGGGGLRGRVGNAVFAPFAVAQGIFQATANDALQRENRKRLDELLRREEAGRLGLDAGEQQLLAGQFTAPVQQQAAAARSRAEQLASASGGVSGADLSRLRQEQQAQTSTAAQNAALQIAGLNEAARQSQLQEISQRTALKSGLKADDIGAVFDGIAQAASASGQAFGAPPATFTAAGAGGTAFASPEEQQLVEFFRANPEAREEILSAAQQRAAAQAAQNVAGTSSAPPATTPATTPGAQ